MIEEMYQENILEHYKNPSNKGRLDGYTNHARELNPLCGDEIEIFLDIRDGAVNDVKFMGNGCAISQASCSMLTEKIKGMRLDAVRRLNKDDVLNMLAIPISYARIKCALLSLSVIKSALI